jgi:hypothetical protein
MSNAPSTLDTALSDELPDDRLGDELNVRSTLGALATPLQFAGFWSAVLFPLLYVPVFAGGVPGVEGASLGVLVAAHAVALVAGHGYQSE